MPTAAPLALAAWRHEQRRFYIRVRGIDLTGKAMLMQVRLAPDTPGEPELELRGIDDGLALGLHLDQVKVEDGVTVSYISGLITKAAMETLPYAGELGQHTTFTLGLQLDGVTRAYGTFTALATTIGSDNAPADRPEGFGAAGRGGGGLWDTAVLTIGTDTVVIEVEGVSIIADLAKRAESAAAEVEDLRVAIDTGVVVDCAAARGENDDAIVLALPQGAALTSGVAYRFTMPTTPNGDHIFLRVGDLARELQFGDSSPAGKNADLRQGYETIVVWEGDPIFHFRLIASAASFRQFIELRTRIADLEADAARGAPVLLNPADVEVNGSTLNLLIPGQDGPVKGQAVYLSLEDPGFPADAKISVNGSPPLKLTRTRNATLNAGDIPGYTFASIVFRQNEAFEWTVVGVGYTATEITRIASNLSTDIAAPIAAIVRDAPYGTIAANNVVTVTQLPVVGCGDSNATDNRTRNGGAPDGYGITDVIAREINALWPLGGVQAVSDNKAFGGQVFNQFQAQLNDSNAYRDGYAGIVSIMGMTNSSVPGNYNSGQAFNGGRDALIALIRATINKGIGIILLWTWMHERTEIYDYAKYFTSDNPGAPQYYPRFVNAPVNPETGMYPPVSKSAGGRNGLAMRDMTGFGVASRYSVRAWHVNKMIRDVARMFENHVILMDGEYSGFRYGVEVSGEASLFSGSEDVHQNAFGHQVGALRPIKQFARDFAAGRLLKREYCGEAPTD